MAPFDTGSTLRLAAEIGNPSDSEGSVRIAWNLPPEFKGVAVVPDQIVKLGGGVTKQIVTEVPIPADLRMPSFGTLIARLDYSLVGVDSWKGTLNVPLQLTRMIPDGAATSRPADFILDTVDSVINFFNADPGNADKVWTGPADLSAQAWITREGDNLVFRCDVTDDIHDQPFMGGDVWKADGIQVAFTIPDQKGNWELGLYQTNAGQVMAHIFAMPADTGLENPWDKTPLKITRENGKTLYEATFPYARYGITDELLNQGVRFAFIVNDSDGKGTREGYIRLAGGIGEGKSTEKFPVIRFKSR